jgi:hypothetical protein
VADDRHVCSGSRDTSVRLWDVATSALVAQAALPLNVVTDVKWAPGDSRLVVQVCTWVVGWLGGWVVGWLGGWVVGWLGGWVVGWLGWVGVGTTFGGSRRHCACVSQWCVCVWLAGRHRRTCTSVCGTQGP